MNVKVASAWEGRAVAQVGSRRITADAVRVRARVKSCVIYDGQRGTAVSPEYFGFPANHSIH
jgi:hypothetical protein